MIPCSQSEPDLVDLLQATARYLWKDWPDDMKMSSCVEGGFTFNGICPHCNNAAAFPSVVRPFTEQDGGIHSSPQPQRMVAVLRCIACNKYVLGIIKHVSNLRGDSWRWTYEAHYPLGKPNDTVSASIPDEIRADFQEALRCRFVNAFNATIEMCRRALEASCIEQGANPDVVLDKMIEWVHSQGKITKHLSDMAHKIKLGGNRAAHHHPSDRTLTDADADAVIEFTREYFQDVYVTPARLDGFNYDKPKKEKKV